MKKDSLMSRLARIIPCFSAQVHTFVTPVPKQAYTPYEPRKIEDGKQGYIYLIREREFVRMQEDVFKIGRSKDFERRFASYPKDSEILCCTYVKNQFSGEKRVIQTFDTLFHQRTDIGREYYEGNREEIMKQFLTLSLDIHKN